MAKFLDGSGSYAAITEIIKNAEEELFIITPYLKIPIQTQNYIKTTDNKNINFTLISRTDTELMNSDIIFLNELVSARILVCDNLHTKCFLNEREGLITSMNLHQHSQTHNWEMGIKFSENDDSSIYYEARKEIKRIEEHSRNNPLIKRNQDKKQPTDYKPKPVIKPKEAPKRGIGDKVLDLVLGEQAYCIRCGEPLRKYDLEHPLCEDCYASWIRHNNPKYQEKYCHACGEKKNKISYEKPICSSCYKKFYY
jgi:hypothetical protein